MRYEAPMLEMLATPADPVMTSLEGMNVVDLWDMLIQGT